MNSFSTDRFTILREGVAVKAPCRVATTANITLAGIQTIDGVLLVADNRVLVKDQTDTTQNGIYTVSSGTWRRAADFDGRGEVVQGTQVFVNLGNANTNTTWRVLTANPAVGSALAFARLHVVELSSIDVKTRFGATGNGVNDDTTAINAAIAVANATGGNIYFPPGTYKVGSLNRVTRNGVTFQGAGQGSTIIASAQATGDTITLDAQFCYIKDVTFQPSVFRTNGF
jgi:polygalacturonase